MNLKSNRRTFAAVAALIVSATVTGHGARRAGAAPSTLEGPPACQPSPEGPTPPPESKPTTVSTIGQVYYCILEHYYRGPMLDDRSLLVPAFASLTQDLQRRGLDQSEATLPALTGKNDPQHRDRNWMAFSQVYERIIASVGDPAVRQAIAAATIRGMVHALNESHASWSTTTGGRNLVGITLSVAYGAPGEFDPAAIEPLVVTELSPGSAAEQAGVRAGDQILAINGVPPYVNGALSTGVVTWITDPIDDRPITLMLHRPVTDATVTVTLIPSTNGGPGPGPGPGPGGNEPPPPGGPGGSRGQLVDGNIAYVQLKSFSVAMTDTVLQDIASLGTRAQLRGVILDVRGNGGGDPNAVARMLGALARDTVTDYFCDGKDHCVANRTDDSVALVNLPVVALIDRRCASACEQFAAGVKDLRLGTLVGTRTAGRVNPAATFLLDDGSTLSVPMYYQLGANREIYNTIGVAADYHAPMTAADLSAGRDPGVAKAIELLR